MLICCVRTWGSFFLFRFWHPSKWSERIRSEMNKLKWHEPAFVSSLPTKCFLTVLHVSMDLRNKPTTTTTKMCFTSQFDASPPKRPNGHISIFERKVFIQMHLNRIYDFIARERQRLCTFVTTLRFVLCVTIIDFFSPLYTRCDHYLWTLFFLFKVALHVIICAFLWLHLYFGMVEEKKKCRNVNDFRFRINCFNGIKFLSGRSSLFSLFLLVAFIREPFFLHYSRKTTINEWNCWLLHKLFRTFGLQRSYNEHWILRTDKMPTGHYVCLYSYA